ncbi:hypothetical protein P4V41_07740 [Fictibacillus nanhaiensis]|uniref:hypothetical protein n=1 Tax=Fictibacillus nanhaiensis TaxID=742169 RepID=UPI002E222319|nr:hypothetical protein [Fictibacillus nanhaiensis]
MKGIELPYEEFILKSMQDTLNNYFPYRTEGSARIKGKSKIFTHDQIHKLINLLHPVYHDLGIEIRIQTSKFKTFIELFDMRYDSTFLNLNAIKKFNGQGAYAEIDNKLWMFEYNIHKKENSDLRKLCALATLFHEIRHAWQSKYKPHLFEIPYINVGEHGYKSQPIEVDAESFSARMMTKHNKEISEILGIDFKWSYVMWNLNV